MFYFNLFFVLCFFVILPTISGFGASPPLLPVICSTLDPLGHMAFPAEESEELDFEINTDKNWFMPNETITSKPKN